MASGAKHLAKGSQQPPNVEGKLRLYAMEYCPYAHRARLVLDAKNIPYDQVNINLGAKPDWYLKIHPEGKVPALDDGSQIVVDSLVILNFLEDKYPDPPLYPADAKADKELIKNFDNVSNVFADCCFKLKEKSPEDWVKAFLDVLQPFDSELAKRGTPFFGGETPGMVDYFMWPWAERYKSINFAVGTKLPFDEKDLSVLRKWFKSMIGQPAVQKNYNGPERFWKSVEIKHMELPDYDSIVEIAVQI